MRISESFRCFLSLKPASRSFSGTRSGKSVMGYVTCTCMLLLILTVPMTALAQKEKDNTGTNPINLTYDYRMYSEMTELVDPNGSQITNTFEFRFPFGRDIADLRGHGGGHWMFDMGKSMAGRIKVRYKTLSLDNPDSEPFGTMEVTGIGDLDGRFLWVPYATGSWGVAPALEAFFNTATNPALGYGVNVLAPTIFFGFFGLMGEASIFAPGYQFWFDVGGGDDSPKIRRSVFDLYFVWILGKGRNWVIVNPQIFIDHENDVVPALADFEWGFMIAPSVGASGWIRPGVGFGGQHRPFEWNIEMGLKFVWR